MILTTERRTANKGIKGIYAYMCKTDVALAPAPDAGKEK